MEVGYMTIGKQLAELGKNDARHGFKTSIKIEILFKADENFRDNFKLEPLDGNYHIYVLKRKNNK